MTKLQRATLRASEIRSKLNGFQNMELSDDQNKEVDGLTNEYQSVERELRMLTITEDKPLETREDGETTEMATMLERSNIGNIFEAALERRSIDGVERELQEHYGINANQVPLQMLETRDVSTLPTNVSHAPVQSNQQAILLPVFANGDGAYLGVDFPTVPSGQAVYPVLTTRAAVRGPFTASNSAAETTGTFTAEVLSPSRLQASFFYRRTDAAKFSMMDVSLRQNLSEALSEAMDQEVIDQLVADVTRSEASAVDTFGSYRKRLVYDNVDGRHANMESDIKVLLGGGSFAHISSVYRSGDADDSALDSLRRVSGGVRVSALIAAVADNKQDAIVRVGNRPMEAVAPTWNGITIIPDEITKAATGEILVTAVMLAAFKTIRTDGFKRVQTQHA